jgi:hypothetical protein
MEPCRTPPLPAEAPTIPRSHQMAPHLLLDPPPHKGKAPARVPDPKVVDPAPQLRVDLRDQRLDWPGLVASEHLLELLQQRRPLLPLRRVLRPHQRPRDDRRRRKSKPKNPKLSPRLRSTVRLFSSFSRTSSFANSSRSRRGTAARHLGEQQILPHAIEGNRHILPTSRAFRRLLRSPAHTIPLKARPWPCWAGRIAAVSCNWCSCCRTTAARSSRPPGPTSRPQTTARLPIPRLA